MNQFLDKTGLLKHLQTIHDGVKYQSPDDEGAMEYQGHIQHVMSLVEDPNNTIDWLRPLVSDVGVSIDAFIEGVK